MSAAQVSTQQLGLPNPAEFEAVFPHIVFGTVDQLKYESELVVANPSDNQSLLEFELLYASGAPAENALPRFWPNRNQFVSLRFNRFYRDLPPHSVQRFAIPGEEGVFPLFVGWAILRSNHEISAVLEISVIHVDSGLSSKADLLANYFGAKTATAQVGSGKTEIFSADPVFAGGQHVGWRVGTNGIALSNPGTKRLQLKLELQGDTASLQIDPRAQKAFLVHEVFGFFTPRAGGFRQQTLKISSESGDPFAIAILALGVQTDLAGGMTSFRGGAPVGIFGPGYRTPQMRRFDFSVPVLQQLAIRDLRIVVTHFGFFLNTLTGQNLRLIKVNKLERVAGNAAVGIAVIYGGGSVVPIVFVDSRKLVIADVPGYGQEPVITELADKKQIKAVLGYPCYRIIILLDKEKEEIISVEITTDSGAFCL